MSSCAEQSAERLFQHGILGASKAQQLHFFTTTTKNMKVIATTLLGLAASANAVSLTPDVSISTDGYCCER